MGPAQLRIARSELIGRPVEIVRSSDPTLVGLEGTVVDETLNTLVVARTNGSEARVAKAACAFAFPTPEGPVVLEGSRIRYRPEDRIKKVR